MPRHPTLTAAEYDTRWVGRVMTRVNATDSGCWEWQGPKSYNGYGTTSYRSRHTIVHRKMFELAKGAIPKGHDVCHSCDVRACCNPAHLWNGTRKQNMQDCSSKRRADGQWKTECMRGHPFTPENTYMAKGLRHCKACGRGRIRLRAGWPEDLAFSMGVVPHGYRPVNATKFRKKAA